MGKRHIQRNLATKTKFEVPRQAVDYIHQLQNVIKTQRALIDRYEMVWKQILGDMTLDEYEAAGNDQPPAPPVH